MFNAKQFIQRLLLAVSLGGTMALAQAEPLSYHVTVNTATLTGSGYFDATLAATTVAAQGLTVSLSNFAGAFGNVDNVASYDYMTIANGFALSNAAPNYLSQQVDFGGELSFDVLFSGAFLSATTAETLPLFFSLWDSAFAQIGDSGGFNVAGTGIDRISLMGSNDLITITANGATEVPEPAALLLMLTAFALMGVMVKRRQG
ncbi:NF038129 family PEP-CTERM protein [Massilia sp. DWR3-1-1]|uniref:NF038129 family PEP-CTERM protein n=1 Tax=Massilia sp. DWR3-1-1 TaxID=2804559 RepID=UPI003CE9181F